MRAAILVLILTVIHYSKQQTPPQLVNVEGWVQECIKATNADPAIIEDAFKEGKFSDDKNLKCFTKCMFVKMDAMTEDGKLNPDKMQAQAPPGMSPEQATTVVNTCKDTTGADPCDIAYNTAKCLITEATKLLGSQGSG